MLLATVLVASPAGSAPTTRRDIGPFEPLVLDLARRGVSMLSLVPMNREDQDLLWATWVEDRPPGTVSHLALIRRHGRSIERIWAARYPDAYEPRITPLYGNLPPGVTAILLRCQFGAAYEEATLYALDRRNAVSKIGSVDGEMVNLLPWQDNTVRADGDRWTQRSATAGTSRPGRSPSGPADSRRGMTVDREHHGNRACSARRAVTSASTSSPVL